MNGERGRQSFVNVSRPPTSSFQLHFHPLCLEFFSKKQKEKLALNLKGFALFHAETMWEIFGCAAYYRRRKILLLTSVGRSVCHNFLNGRENSLPCSYPNTCWASESACEWKMEAKNVLWRCYECKKKTIDRRKKSDDTIIFTHVLMYKTWFECFLKGLILGTRYQNYFFDA